MDDELSKKLYPEGYLRKYGYMRTSDGSIVRTSRTPSTANDAPSPKPAVSSAPSRAVPARPAPQPLYPPAPPQSSGTRPLVDKDGYVYEKPLGSGDYRPKTTIGGIQQQDTTIGGIPAHRPTIGLPTQARNGVLGPPIYGPEGQPLYEGRTPGPISGP